MVALATLAIQTGSFAQGLGGLTVTPTRIVLEGRSRSAEVTLINTTSSPATYRISFKNMRMLENGSYEDIEEPVQGELFADRMIRYAPRQVTLDAGMSQTVRLLVRKPAELAPGEYRSHLLFQSLPPESAGEDIENTGLDETGIQIQIRTVFAVTIPVIVRHGALSANVSIAELKLNSPDARNDGLTVSMQLNRTGSESVYGEVEATFMPDAGEDVYDLGLVRGLGVLYPYPTRKLTLPLKLPDGLELRNGRLRVVYRAASEEGGSILAESELHLP